MVYKFEAYHIAALHQCSLSIVIWVECIFKTLTLSLPYDKNVCCWMKAYFAEKVTGWNTEWTSHTEFFTRSVTLLWKLKIISVLHSLYSSCTYAMRTGGLMNTTSRRHLIYLNILMRYEDDQRSVKHFKEEQILTICIQEDALSC